MLELAFEYYGLVVLLSTSTIQLASSYRSLKGVTFIPNPKLNCALALVIMLPCLAALATWNWRNPVGIIEGAQQFYLFMLGIISAVGLTIIISSLVNHSRFKNTVAPLVPGFESLNQKTYFQALSESLRKIKWRG